MQVLRFTSPTVDEPIPWTANHSLSLAADRHVAVTHGRALHVYDLRSPAEPVARIPDVVDHGLTSTCLITADPGGMITRWERREGSPSGWEATVSFPMPHAAGAASPLPDLLLLSASGRFLLVESAPIARQPPMGPRSRAYLLDAVTGEVKRAFEMDATWVRGGFARLPSREEVLFISAEDDMSVQMVACASGQTRHAYVHVYGSEHAEEFCHTDYALTADATRLLTFGCSWGAPYEARIYDATPWTRPRRATPRRGAVAHPPAVGTPVPAGTFPLPLVCRQEEVFGDVRVLLLPFGPHQARDHTVTSVALADLAGVPAADAPDASEQVRELSETDRAIYRQLRLLPRTGTGTGTGVIIRRIDPTTGEVVGWSVAATAKTEERHAHVLADHRVLLVSDRIQIVDGLAGTVRDEGPFEAPARWYVTLPTTSGDTLIVHETEGTR